MVDEAERSLHDALCVVRSLIKNKGLLPGGGAPEVELAVKLQDYALTLKGVDQLIVRKFAEALEVVPYTLAENAGMNPIQVVTELKNKHAQGFKNAGISIKKGNVAQDITTEQLDERFTGIVQPSLVTSSALQLATECVRMILKIDDLVLSAR